jgi:hypothetical protein
VTEEKENRRAHELATIWQGDLFGRREEAELLLGYLESIYRRPSHREDARAYTVAIDAGYGEGKTFFLRRLATHISLTHPVAFVDAWADDLADQPMTALAATLKEALKDELNGPEIRSRWTEFMSKSGKVARIAGIGLAKRGLGLLLTAGAVDAASEVLNQTSEAVHDAINDGLSEAGKGLVDDSVEGAKTSSRLMEERIAQFQAGRDAINSMKESLRAVISSLISADSSPPIVIIIDELDRCRPTYAIKLLEEIKHLFDVPGIVFVFGLHGEQLAHSVAGAYGTGFDGISYLRRFFRRRYALNEPNLVPLLQNLVRSTSINLNFIAYPEVRQGRISAKVELPELISKYMKSYGLRPRDAFEVVDMLETCCALSAPYNLYMPYLLPLIMAHVSGRSSRDVIDPPNQFNFDYEYHISREPTRISPIGLAREFELFSRYTESEFQNTYDNLSGNYAGQAIADVQYRQLKGQVRLARIDRYADLISTVSRFTVPDSPSELVSSTGTTQ